MTASPDECSDKPRKGARFWHVLPWVLLAIVGLILAAHWVNFYLAIGSANAKMNERFEGGKGLFEVVDYWESGEGYQVIRYRTRTTPVSSDADWLTVVAPQRYSVILQEDAQTHELTGVAVHHNTEVILLASKDGQSKGPFPQSFSFLPQTGPDAGNWLLDSNADGKFDFKVIGRDTPSTKYLRWEEGKGWVDCVWDDAPEEAKRSLSH